MKIAIDARIISTSTGRYTAKLIENLQELDSVNQYGILLLKKDFETWKPKSKNFAPVLADFPNYTFSEQSGLHKLLNKLEPELVHFTFQSKPILYKRPYVLTVHDLNLLRIQHHEESGLKFETKQRVYKSVFRKMVTEARIVLVPTVFVRDDLAAYAPAAADRIRVTYESSDKIDVPPAVMEQFANIDFLFYVGQSAPHKNLGRLMEAHQRLLSSHPSLHLVIAGKKDFFTGLLEKDVAAKGYQQIHFPGFVSEAELRWLYENARVYVFPSLMEGFGLPGLEAMQYGLPVASSAATCLPEVYRDAAEYFNPVDTHDIARAINLILTNPQHRDQLIINGHRLVGEYSWRRMAEDTLNAYREALLTP